MEKQLLGSQTPLKTNSPLNYKNEGDTGNPEKQLLGSEAPISYRPVPLQEFDKHTRPIEKQLLGSEVPLDTTPRHGWQSDTRLSMSERSIQQSK